MPHIDATITCARRCRSTKAGYTMASTLRFGASEAAPSMCVCTCACVCTCVSVRELLRCAWVLVPPPCPLTPALCVAVRESYRSVSLRTWVCLLVSPPCTLMPALCVAVRESNRCVVLRASFRSNSFREWVCPLASPPRALPLALCVFSSAAAG